MEPLRELEQLDAKGRALAVEAHRIRDLAYAPYSRFHVGAALEDSLGQVHTGCNVENASYSATICAERTALVKMVSTGSRKLRRVALITTAPEPCFPCGVCLQALQEFADGDVEVIALDGAGRHYRAATLRQLFPSGFTDRDLRGMDG